TDAGTSMLESGHYNTDDRYFCYRARGTDSWVLFYTIAGRGYFRFRNGQVHLARPRQLCLYSPNVEHDFGTCPGERWNFHWVHFKARPTWSSWLKWPPLEEVSGVSQLMVPSPGLNRRIVHNFQELHRDLRMRSLWRREMALASLEKILLIAVERLRSERG